MKAVLGQGFFHYSLYHISSNVCCLASLKYGQINHLIQGRASSMICLNSALSGLTVNDLEKPSLCIVAKSGSSKFVMFLSLFFDFVSVTNHKEKTDSQGQMGKNHGRFTQPGLGSAQLNKFESRYFLSFERKRPLILWLFCL